MTVLTAISVVRGAIGYAIFLGVTLAFLIAGNTAGRLIGVGLLALCAYIAFRIVRGLSRKSG